MAWTFNPFTGALDYSVPANEIDLGDLANVNEAGALDGHFMSFDGNQWNIDGNLRRAAGGTEIQILNDLRVGNDLAVLGSAAVSVDQAITGDMLIGGTLEVTSGLIDAQGGIYNSAGVLLIQDDAAQNVYFFASAAAGENPVINIYGDFGGATRYGRLQINTAGNLLIEGQGDFIILDSNVGPQILDDKNLYLGSGPTTSLRYNSTNNAMMIGGELGGAGARSIIVCDYNDTGQDMTALLGAVSFPTIYIVDTDADSYIKFGYSADDNPEIELYSAISSSGSLIRQSDAEGVAGDTDLRIGLDESMRTLIICDRGDIGANAGLPTVTNPTLFLMHNNGTNYMRLSYGSIVSEPVLSVTAAAFDFIAGSNLSAGHMVEFVPGVNIRLTGTDAEQAWMYFNPDVNQSATAAYVGLLMDVTETAIGSGAAGTNGNALIALRVGGNSRFVVDRAGIIRFYDSTNPAYQSYLYQNSMSLHMAGYKTSYFNNWGANNDAGSNFWFACTKQLTDANGEQGFVAFTPNINQSGTAAYVGLLMDVTETGTGDGSTGVIGNALMDLRVGGASKFGVDNTGILRYGRQGAIYAWTYQGDVADDGTFNLPAFTDACWGFIQAGSNEEYAMFTVTGNGAVTLISNSANVSANADVDGDLCVGTAAAQEPLVIKNRLAAQKNINMMIWYS